MKVTWQAEVKQRNRRSSRSCDNVSTTSSWSVAPARLSPLDPSRVDEERHARFAALETDNHGLETGK
jgi:hypothetical protein